jgi:TolA-binding protein
MTREDILKLFPTATEEQIKSILGKHHEEVSAEKAKNKASAENEATIAELRKQLEDLQNKDLSDTDKLQKQIDDLTKQNQAANNTIKNMELKNSLLGKGISAEDADKFIEGLKADKFDAGILEGMINNAIAAKEKSDLKNTPNLGGANGGDSKSDAEKLVAGIYSSDKKQQDILSNYIK